MHFVTQSAFLPFLCYTILRNCSLVQQTLKGKIMAEQELKQKEKGKYNMWQSAGFMIRLAIREREKKVPILCVLTALLAVANNLTGLYVAPVIIGSVEAHQSLNRLFLIMLAFLFLNILLNGASGYLYVNVLYGRVTVRSSLIARLNTKMAVTSYPNTDNDELLKKLAKAGDALNSNAAAGEAIWTTLTDLLRDVTGFLFYLMLLSHVNPLLIAAISAATVAGYCINKPLSEYRYRHREEEGECDQMFWHFFTCTEDKKMAKDIRIFGMQPWLEQVFSSTRDTFRAFHRRVQNRYLWGSIANLILALFQNGFAYAYLIWLVLNEDLSVSMFLLYFSAVGNFSAWVSGILNGFLTLHKQGLEISNIRECLEFPEPFLFEEGKPIAADTANTYEIRLEDVSFRYPDAAADTLSHIDLTLRPGEKLAVVGLNGAGKTTLIKLLCGFLDPTEGKVLLNGNDIRQYDRRDYYRLFSAVFQDFNILATTIAANIAQTEDHIDSAKMKECVEKAGLTRKIESLPLQYDSKMLREIYDDAVTLSGGETQRLMLARALYKDAPLVVLDEPTAALDPIAEADMYCKYDEMTQGRSSVYISHRLASTRFCDRILLIEGGRIAEEGTHEKLLAMGGRYAQLYEVQSRYYKEGADGNEPQIIKKETKNKR